ncbi:MAG: SPASM domain-containing protein [Thermoguttaceae bacterium]
MMPANREQWTQADLSTFKEQMLLVATDLADNFRKGQCVSFSGICDHIRNMLLKPPSERPTCGAGRGMVTIDIDGNIWPCSRFTGHQDAGLMPFGNIYESFFDERRSEFYSPHPSLELSQSCEKCNALMFCHNGCYVENHQATGNPRYKFNANCEFEKIYTEVGRQLNDTLYAERCLAFMKLYYPNE